MDVNDLLFRSAARFGPRTAIVSGAAELSYTGLLATVRRYARRMREAGLGRGSVVAVRLDRSLATVPVFLATQWIGAAYLPIDDRQPPARVRFMLTDAGCDGLILEDEAAHEYGDVPAVLRRADLPVDGDGPAAEHGDTAYVLYTSGSTGRPKAVPISTANLAFLIDWLEQTYTPAEVALSAFTISVGFDVSFAEMLTPLIHGGTLVVFEDLFAVDGTTLPLTALANVPGNLARYLERRALPDTLRVVTSLGEPLRPDLARRLMTGTVRLINAYGPTEATVYTAHHVVEAADLERAAIPIGRVFDGVTAEVLRADGSGCPDGEPGELVITGPNVSSGYRSAHARDSGAFSRAPDAAYPTYRTGDIVVRDPSGILTCLGRVDRQCKVNGIRVDLQEVTTWLLRGTGVANGHVCARETAVGTRLAAFVVATPDATPDPATLRAELTTVLPRYAVPGDVVVVAALPLTFSGKVDEAALLRLLDEEPAAVGDRVDELLRLCTDPTADGAVGPDPLAHMSSLELIQFRRRLLEEHGADVPLQQIYRCSGAAKLRELVRRRRVGTPAVGDGAARETCGIGEQNLWLADMMDPQACANNEVYRLTFAEPVDPGPVEAALRQCVREFPALRTSFRHRRGRLVKEVAGADDVDLRLAPPPSSGASPAGEPFDLASPLKIRASRDADPRSILLYVHHIAIDAEAVDMLLERLAELLSGEPAGRPEAAGSDAGWTGAAGPEELRRFWRDRLSTLKGGTAPQPGNGRARRREAVVSGPAYRSLRDTAARARTSIFGMVHAALTTSIGRELRLDTVSLGTPVSRRAADDRRVACLSNMIPLVAVPRTVEDPTSYLSSLRRDMLESFEHAAITLSELRSAQADPDAPLMHGMVAEIRKPGRSVQLFNAEELFTGVIKMPLMFLFEDRGDALRLICEHDPDSDVGARADALLAASIHELAELGAAPAAGPTIQERKSA